MLLYYISYDDLYLVNDEYDNSFIEKWIEKETKGIMCYLINGSKGGHHAQDL